MYLIKMRNGNFMFVICCDETTNPLTVSGEHVFFSQLIEHFHRTRKKVENPAKYELFLPKALTLALFR